MSGRRRRRIWIGLATVVALLGVVAIVGSLVLGSYVRHRQDQLLGQLSARLGRKVTVGRVSTSVLGGARVTAENVTIAGDRGTPGDEAPLLTAERVRVRVSLLRAIASLGRHVTVTELSIQKPRLSLVRFGDNTLNIDRVADHWRRTAPSGPSAPMSARTRNTLESARIAEARIEQGQLHFVDLQQGGATGDVNAVDLAIRDVGAKTRPSVQLRAAVLSSKQNLDLHAQLGRAGSLDRAPPLESLRLTLDRVNARPLTPLLTRGAPVDAMLDADLESDARKGDLNVRRLDVVVDGMALLGHGRVHSLTTRPRFESFAFETRNLDFDRLRHAYPALDRRLGATLHGPAELRASASGSGATQRFSLTADLTGASVLVPGEFDKPRGAPLHINLGGNVRDDGLDAEYKIRSRQSDLSGTLALRNFSRPRLELTGRSGYLDTDDLMLSSKGKPAERKPGPSPLARMSGHATVSVARGVLSGVAVDGLDADATLKDGVLRASKLEVGTLGGHLSGGGSELSIADEHGPFHLVGQASNVDAAQLLERAGGGNVLKGRLSAHFDVHGRGTSAAELERTLAGTLAGQIQQAQLLAFSLEDVVASKLVSALPFHLSTHPAKKFTDLGTVDAQLQFADGGIVLTRPLTATPPGGPLELTGRLFFDGRLDLTGTWRLSPAGVASLLGGRVHPSGPLTLSLKIGGTLQHPSVGIPNLNELIPMLAGDVGNLAEDAGKLLKVPGTQQAAGKLRDLFRR